VPIRIQTPDETEPTRTLVWAHGGSFVRGDLDRVEPDRIARELAQRRIRVITVDYRLAGDGAHFPIPNDDIRAAFRWAVERFGDVGLAGASAGAALPTCLVLAVPLLHPFLPPLSTQLKAVVPSIPADLLFAAESVDGIALTYAGSREAMGDPHAFAGLADLHGLPPTLVITAEFDTLRASGELFTADLTTAGVDAHQHRMPGVDHGYLNDPDSNATIVTADLIAEWLGR
jgi:acetyl esterase/lipase